MRQSRRAAVDAFVAPGARSRHERESRALTDWLEILKEQTETGNRMACDVPKMLADPDITP